MNTVAEIKEFVIEMMTDEVTYCEKKKLYRKRFTHPDSGEHKEYYGKTKKELFKKIENSLIAEFQYNELQKSPYMYVYITEWYEKWLKNDRGYKNIESTRNAINNYIAPALGQKRMCEITSEECENVINHIGEEGKSKATCIKIRATMKKIFAQAVKDGYFDSNPAENLELTGYEPEEKNALSDEEADIFFDTIKDLRIFPFSLIAFYSGMRREEIIGLKWDSVFLDSETPYIYVRRAARWEKNNNQPIVTNTLKSTKSKRKIPISKILSDFLRELRKKSTGDFVIGGEAPWTQSQFKNAWKSVTARSTGTVKRRRSIGNVIIEKKLGDKIPNHDAYVTIDFNVSPHILRHTYITNLANSGVPIKMAQALAGHEKSETMLDIYTHVSDKDIMDSADDITRNQSSNIIIDSSRRYFAQYR